MGPADSQSPAGSFPKEIGGADTTWLFRFGDKDWRDKLKKAAQDYKFNATLKPRIDREVEKFQASQPPIMPAPIIIEEPIDKELQTGESMLLGGPMSIHSPWEHGE